jgi:hypothetical protein
MGTEQNHFPEIFDRVETNSIFKRTHFALLAVIENESTIAHKRQQFLFRKIKVVLAALSPSMRTLYHRCAKTIHTQGGVPQRAGLTSVDGVDAMDAVDAVDVVWRPARLGTDPTQGGVPRDSELTLPRVASREARD